MNRSRQDECGTNIFEKGPSRYRVYEIKSGWMRILSKRLTLLFYVDDGVFLSPNEDNIKQAVQPLKDTGFEIEYQGYLLDYLGIICVELPDGRIHLPQPYLIDQITKETGITHLYMLILMLVTHNTINYLIDNNGDEALIHMMIEMIIMSTRY